MGPLVPELQYLPNGLVLDRELVAWKGRGPCFPALCRRILNGDTSIPLSYVVFALLGVDGTDLTQRPYEERTTLLEQLDLHGAHWHTTEVLDDGGALYDAVCEMGLEGVVAKRTTSRYGPNRRGWGQGQEPELLAAQHGARRDVEIRRASSRKGVRAQ
jgi:bifunctional non-homologous end joining protein LigD